jgi:hypothetical protein
MNKYPVAASKTPDVKYVKLIIGLRPIVSNRRPSRTGPAKFPNARAICTNRPDLTDAIEVGQDQRVGEKDRVVEECLCGHQVSDQCSLSLRLKQRLRYFS